MADLDDIMKNGKGKLPQDKLMSYLEGKLSPEEQHEVEAWLADESMEADAIEGLKEIQPADARQIAGKLNHKLRNDLKKPRRRSKPIVNNEWAWLAVIIILLLCILGYMVLSNALK